MERSEQRGTDPRPTFGEIYYYRSTPELRDKLTRYQEMGEKLIPPVRILRDWGLNIPSPARLNRFIMERWSGVFPVADGTKVRIPGSRTEEFLLLFEKDPYATRSVHSEDAQRIMDVMMNNADVYLQIKL